ncbi:MAG: DbpA RNA binding domain-containing protein, partial [Flavobacteriaceae bacterium]
VDTKDSFSFFNTDAQHTEQVLQTFSEFKVDGRFINVEVSKNPGGSGRGGRKRDKKRGHRKGGDNRSYKGGRKNSSGKRGGKKRPGFY